MAIEFARVQVYTRSKGHSAVHAAAYRAGALLHDERLGQSYDYEKRKDVIYSNIMLPDGGTDKFLNREALWNAVERAEKRTNSQVCKDIILALPKELSNDDRITLARKFAETHFVSNGLVVDINVHDHGEGNPHAHLLVTTRRLLGAEFDTHKARDLNPGFFKGKVVEQDAWNRTWADFQNAWFVSHGIELNVDPTSMIPTVHQGRINPQEAHYLKQENALIKQANIEIAQDSPASIINHLLLHKTVISDRDLASSAMKYTGTLEDFQALHARLKQSPELISLGVDEAGFESYTTKALYKKEVHMLERAITLAKSKPEYLPMMSKVKKAIVNHQLNDEQAHAVRSIIEGGQLVCMVGRAGIGKSYSAKALNEIYSSEDFRVLGSATAGVAAMNLQNSSNIQSRVIDSLRYSIAEEKLKLTSRDVIILDEAGMVDLDAMSDIIKAVTDSGAKLILMGDPEQLPAVMRGDPFKGIISYVGSVELSQIQRQQKQGDRDASLLLARGNIKDALSHYATEQAIHFESTDVATMTTLLSHWESSLKTGDLKNHLILAHRNLDIDALNLKARAMLLLNGILTAECVHVTTAFGEREFRVGERILFRKNDTKLKVMNGQFATIESFNGHVATVKLDNGDTRSINLHDYKHLDYGYATTVHKSQGISIDNVFVYTSGKAWDKHLSYVALTRHKQNLHIYASETEHKDLEALSRHLGRSQLLDSVIQWPVSFALRRGLSPESVLGKFFEYVGEKLTPLHDTWDAFAHRGVYEKRKALRETRELRSQDRTHAKVVAEYVQTRMNVQKGMSALQSTVAGTEKNIYGQAEFKPLYQLIKTRNAHAATLYANIERYEQAININRLDIVDIKKHANAHEHYLTVEKYLNATGAEKEKLAFILVNAESAKDYFFFIKQEGINTKTLRQQATAHEASMILETATPVENNAITLVREYQLACDTGQTAWKQYFDNKDAKLDIKKTLITVASDYSEQRDKLASNLFEKREQEEVKLALSLYGIVDNDQLSAYDLKGLKQHHEFEQIRATQLEQYSGRNEARENVIDYMILLDTENKLFTRASEQRLALAKVMKDSPAFHHKIIMNYVKDWDNTHQMKFWSALSYDHQRALLTQDLKYATPENKTLLENLEYFVDIFHNRSELWKEYYSQPVKTEAPYKQSQEYDKALQMVMETLINDHAGYEKIAERYGIPAQWFDKITDKLEVSVRIKAFQSPDLNIETKCQMAEVIYDDLKSHYPALKEHGIDIKEIEKLALIQKKYKAFEASFEHAKVIEIIDERNIVEKSIQPKEEPRTFKAWLDSVDWKALQETNSPYLGTLLQAKKHYDLAMTQEETKLIVQAEKFITNAINKLWVQHERYQVLNDIPVSIVKSLETWKKSIEKTLSQERTQKQDIGIGF